MTVDAGTPLRVAAKLRYDIGGQVLINVMHFKLVTPATLADALVLADIGEVIEVFYNTVLTRINDSVIFEDYTVTDVDRDVILGTDTWPTLTTGSGVDDALPPQNAALVLARTVKPRKQGRVYLPGFVESAASGSAWIPAAVTSLANFAAEMLAGQVVTNGSYAYQVYTRADDGPPIVIAALDDPTTAAVISYVRTQRRRSSFFGA